MSMRAADSELERWLHELDVVPAAEDGEGAQRLLYLLDCEAGAPPVAALHAISARRRSDGGYSGAQAQPKAAHSHARHVSELDRRLLQFIDRQQRQPGPPWQLQGGWGAEMLHKLLASGRCHWHSEQSPALSFGEPRSGEFRWHLGDDGRSHLRLEVEGATAVLPVEPPWYVDLRKAVAGPIDSGVPPRLAAQLLSAKPAAPDELSKLSERWSAVLGEHALRVPPPPPVHFRRRRDVHPVPVLALRQTWLSQSWAREETIDAASLSFDYGGLRCTPDTPVAPLVRVVDGHVTQIERQPAREQALLTRLRQTRLEPVRDYYRNATGLLAPPPSVGRAGWVDFLAAEAPKLRAEGWRLEIDPDFPWRLHEPEDGDWQLRVAEGNSDGGWFDIGLHVVIDGRETALLPLLVALLRQSGDKLTPAKLQAMADDAPLIVRDDAGRLIRLPAGRVKPILCTLIELYDDAPLQDDGSLRLPRWAGALLDGLGRDASLREAVVTGALSPSPVAPPKGLQAELRNYQFDGLSWLQWLRERGLGGVLADDMGLGKTLQTLAHVLLEKEQGRLDRPVLVVAPTSLVFNWRREAARFTPDLRVLVLHGHERRKRFSAMAHVDLVLTTYALLPRDLEALKRQRWHILILDEAQNIKNPRSKAATSVAQLDARHRLCMSGTPLENHLGELWSLFHFLMPGYLGDDPSFRRRFRTPIEKHDDAGARAQLARRVGPLLLRRTKNEVARELPPRTEIIRSVALEGAQRDLYETVRTAMQDELQAEIERHGLAQSRIALLAALLKLRQICCDPRLLKRDEESGEAEPVHESAKLDLLMTLLPDMLRQGRRILLFSQFTSMLALIEEALKERGIDYLLLTGSTQDRESLVDRFQREEVPLFLISLKAGGVGLNLTAADTVIHYDPWWNPAVENQATDRAHRIGQDKPVFVYKLLSEGTVEEKIAELQARKRQLAEALFADSGEHVDFDGETVAELFAPLN